jgi:hypothetical protein
MLSTHLCTVYLEREGNQAFFRSFLISAVMPEGQAGAGLTLYME